MNTIKLGFKAFDPHELLCHFVASKAGLYLRENLNVELIDITFMDDLALPKDLFQASCGAALSSALKGSTQRILFVATDMPMFWIYSRKEITSLADLTNSSLATFPVIAPPHHLANIILQKSGVNSAQQMTLLPARDDVARFGLLKSGSVDAAVISSSIAPPVIEESGFNNLCFFGNEIRIPTTGLAVDESFLQKEPELVHLIIKIHKESLALIHNDVELLEGVLSEYYNVADQHVKVCAALYQHFYTENGRTTETIAQNAIDSLCKSLSLSSVPIWNQLYTFPE